MAKCLKQATKHPKTTASIVFFILLFIFSFAYGYKQDRDNEKYKGNTSHHFWNGIKWFLIIFVIIVVFFSTLAIAFQMNWWESLLWGGDLVSLAGQLIITLLDALTQK